MGKKPTTRFSKPKYTLMINSRSMQDLAGDGGDEPRSNSGRIVKGMTIGTTQNMPKYDSETWKEVKSHLKKLTKILNNLNEFHEMSDNNETDLKEFLLELLDICLHFKELTTEQVTNLANSLMKTNIIELLIGDMHFFGVN